MYPDNSQNQNNIPNHVPISKLKEQLDSKDKLPITNQDNQINNNQPIIISPSSIDSTKIISQNTDRSLASNTSTVSLSAQLSSDKGNQTVEPIPKSQTIANYKHPNKFLINILVIIQFVSLLVIIIGFYPSPLFTVFSLMLIGVLIIAFGLFLGIWSFLSFHQKISISPTPPKHSFLVTGGPYKYIRHPMYATLILISMGLFLIYPSVSRLGAIVVLIAVLSIKMNIEENLLAERYHHYSRYQRLTGKLIPKLHKPKIDINIDLPKFE